MLIMFVYYDRWFPVYWTLIDHDDVPLENVFDCVIPKQIGCYLFLCCLKNAALEITECTRGLHSQISVLRSLLCQQVCPTVWFLKVRAIINKCYQTRLERVSRNLRRFRSRYSEFT